MRRIKIAVLVSGGGTNLQAIIDAQKSGILKSGEVSLVVADKKEAYALTRAENNNIKTDLDEIRSIFIDTYKEMYGKDPVIKAIHAGLECGIFCDKIEGIDCISLGPNMSGVHTTEERLSISSTERTWKLLVEVLKRLK